MPELPEVEHVRQNLDRWMKGRTIAAVRTNDARLLRPIRPRTFVDALVGRTIVHVDRRGKWLRLVLDDGASVFSHLGMTGWFEQGDAGGSPVRFERVGFELVANKSGKPGKPGKRTSKPRATTHVAYTDPRRWGRMWLSVDEVPAWTELGPDPLRDGIDVAHLEAKLARRTRRSIKEVLLDQSVLAGVGNIQSIEALWKAGIDPRTPAGAVDRAGIKALVAGLRWTIARTLEDLTKNGMKGDSPFKVYGRKGTPCPRCKTTLERIELGGRTTTFCPGCQVLAGAPPPETTLRAKPKRGAKAGAKPKRARVA